MCLLLLEGGVGSQRADPLSFGDTSDYCDEYELT